MVNYTNLSGLENIQPINLSFTALENDNILAGIMQTVQTEVGDFWFHAASIIIFFALVYLLYKQDGDFIYGASRSMFLSAGFTLLLSIAIVLSGWVTTIFPLIWFSSIFLITGIAVYNLKSDRL